MVTTVRRAVVFEFSKCDLMLDAVEKLYQNELTRKIKSRLFIYDGKYRMLFFADIRQQKILNTVNDYAVLHTSSGVEAARTEEYGRIISRDNAVYDIGRWL